MPPFRDNTVTCGFEATKYYSFNAVKCIKSRKISPTFLYGMDLEYLKKFCIYKHKFFIDQVQDFMKSCRNVEKCRKKQCRNFVSNLRTSLK